MTEADAVLLRRRPPQVVIDEAVRQARLSPCAKSKRGVVLYNVENAETWARNGAISFVTLTLVESQMLMFMPGSGFNGPPKGFHCDGSDACKRDCPKICIHAEDRAIRAGATLDDVVDLELVHVKVVDGVLVGGGGPSCWQCSRLVVESGLRGVWLFEQKIPWETHGAWRYYTAVEFHLETARACGLHLSYRQCGKYMGDNDATCPQLTCIRPRGHAPPCDNVKP